MGKEKLMYVLWGGAVGPGVGGACMYTNVGRPKVKVGYRPQEPPTSLRPGLDD